MLETYTAGCVITYGKLIRRTGLVVNNSKFRHKLDLERVQVGDEYITHRSSSRNLGFIIHNCLCMEQHVGKIRNDASYYLRNIAKISKYLT